MGVFSMKNSDIVKGLILYAKCVVPKFYLFPRKPLKNDGERYGKRCINDRIKPAGRIHSEYCDDGKKYYFPMADDRGIKFNVIALSGKEVLVEVLTPFYGKNLIYKTDYKSCVIKHYSDKIENILKSYNVDDYKIRDRIQINLTDAHSLEDVASMIIDLDNLLDYDYRNNNMSRETLDKDKYWESTGSYDISINMKNGENKFIIYKSFLFSDNHRTQLTYDMVLKTLEQDKAKNTNC